MTIFLRIVAIIFLLCGMLHAMDLDGGSGELQNLVDDNSVEIVAWDSLRVERAWSYCFILGLFGVTLGSLMAGATCEGILPSSDKQTCQAGIGIAVASGLLFIAGGMVGLIYECQRGYADLYNQAMQIRDETPIMPLENT